jgi:ATP-dependent DNA helicase RecG
MKTGVKILSAIRANNMITREELAQSLAMTIKGVDWQIAKLKQEGVLKRIGPDKGGHWEIL